MQLHGSAVLTLLGKTLPAQMTLDLASGHIELSFERRESPMPFEQLAVLGGSEQAVKLSSIEISAPFGKLSLDRYENFFAVEYSPEWHPNEFGSASVLSTGSAPISRLVLQPRSSQISFECPIPALGTACEMVLEASMSGQSDEFDVDVAGTPVHAAFRGSKLILSSDTSLQPHKDGLMCSFGMLFGGPASLRSSREVNRIDINIAPHSNGAIDRLWLNKDDIPEMFRASLDFFCSARLTDAKRWHRAATLHLHGLGDKVLLDQRILSLYTSLEMLDEASTLTKNSVGKVLDITVQQAELVCKVRHALVHSGASISEAVIGARKELAMARGSVPVELGFVIDESRRSAISSRYFFWLAAALNRYWLRKVGFSGAANDYSYLIRG